jgi:hypothetical protein
MFDEMELEELEVVELDEFDGEYTQAPLEHSLEEAVEGSLDEDKDVIFDEISE